MNHILQNFLDQCGLGGDAAEQVSNNASRRDLVQLFADLGYRRGAEIGVWAGGFSEVLCQGIPDLHLACVDPWRQYKAYGADRKKNDQVRLEDAYQRACLRLKPYRCQILRMTSLEAAAQIPDGSLDFVYIDANHAREFVEQDLRAWAPKVRPGGIVSGHDYEPIKRTKWLEVKQAVETYRAANPIKTVYVLAQDKMPSFFWVVS